MVTSLARNKEKNTTTTRIKLETKMLKIKNMHQFYVTDSINCEAVVDEVVEILKNYLDERLQIDDSIVTPTTKFILL